MRIPEKIKILGHFVDVFCREPKHLPGLVGDCQRDHNQIRINSSIPESQMAQVLMHELIEIIDAMLELKMQHPQMTALSEVLFQVLRDNDIDFRNKEEAYSCRKKKWQKEAEA